MVVEVNLNNQALPSISIIVSTVFFFTLERIKPGRSLPNVKDWYLRALAINFVQLMMMGIAGITWNKFFREYSFFQTRISEHFYVEGLFYWFIGSFVFYWWHKLRHANGFWLAFHQLHHSPQRIEVLTSFYKHPVEMASDSILIGFVIYTIFGGSPEAGAWFAFYAATAEYFYHANIKTPHWVGYFIQRPEHHSIHHQLDVHKYNYSDLTIWDRLFGTFKDTEHFADQCGFPNNNERYVKDMVLFKDVYKRE